MFKAARPTFDFFIIVHPSQNTSEVGHWGNSFVVLVVINYQCRPYFGYIERRRQHAALTEHPLIQPYCS